MHNVLCLERSERHGYNYLFTCLVGLLVLNVVGHSKSRRQISNI